MERNFIDIASIADLHKLYACPPPRHPLVSVIDLSETSRDNFPEEETFFRLGFYAIYLKELQEGMRYGKSVYDFDGGALMFTAPHQAVASKRDHYTDNKGWGLFFLPELLHQTPLAKKIGRYSFFHYEVNEALHVSEEEKSILRDCVDKIRQEYEQRIDKHTRNLIVTNIELLLNYCDRFYDRQFLTRAGSSNDLVQRFEALLKEYFAQDTLAESGLPDVARFAAALHLSPNYLSDLLKKYTGKTTQEHIHLQLVERAKILLWDTEKPVSEIAYELGFEHPSHFTRLFKGKTGKAPREYRSGL